MFISKTVIVLLFFVTALVGVIIYLLFKNHLAAKKNEALVTDFKLLETKINSIELDGLKYKIEPHLFKNILNSIQSHAYQTYFSLDKLSNVLDYILYESKNRLVTPKEEIEFALNLIEINKIKVSPLFDIKVKTKIDESDPIYQQRL